MPRVFISHSSADNEFGVRLVHDLRRELGDDNAVWYDSAGGLAGGDAWWHRIVVEITDRDVFIVILSPEAVTSKWVLDEIILAWKQKNSPAGKTIIPVLYRSCASPEYLSIVQFVSFESPRAYPDAFAELVAAIRDGSTRRAQIEAASLVFGPPFDEALLPEPPQFIGRGEDLDWLLRRLEVRGATGITAVRGMGGIGKTSLVSIAVHRLRAERRFPDGIAVLLCHGLSDPDEVLSRVLARFHPQRRQLEPADRGHIADLTRTLLQGKDALIVLDNVEPSLKIADVVTPLREVGATILITARHVLPRMAVSAEGNRALNLLSTNEAIDLFAQTLGHTLQAAMSPVEIQAIQRIVAALDCHTLAVKLAGAYAADLNRDLSLLADELENPQRAIELPDGEVPRGVALAFAQSTAALDADTQALFSALAMYGTTEFGRNSALFLAQALALADPRASVDLLVLRALVTGYTDSTMAMNGDRERLRLHPLMRAFAASELARIAVAARDQAAEAIALYYSRYTHQCDSASLSFDEVNIKAALEWAHQARQLELTAALVDGMQPFWLERWRTSDSLRYLPWGIESTDVTTSHDAAPHLQRSAAIRFAYGQVLERVSRLDEAEQVFRDNLKYRQALGDMHGVAQVQRAIGDIHYDRGQLDRAELEYASSLTLYRRLADHKGEATALVSLGWAAYDSGRKGDAERWYEQALQVARDAGNRLAESEALSQLGQIAQDTRRWPDAEVYYQQALAIDRTTGNRQGEGQNLTYLGRLARDQGRYDEAERYLLQALDLRREVMDYRGVGIVQSALAQTANRSQRVELAEAYYRQSLRTFRDVQDAVNCALISLELGSLLVQHRNNREEGCGLLLAAVDIRRQYHLPGVEEALLQIEHLGCNGA